MRTGPLIDAGGHHLSACAAVLGSLSVLALVLVAGAASRPPFDFDLNKLPAEWPERGGQEELAEVVPLASGTTSGAETGGEGEEEPQVVQAERSSPRPGGAERSNVRQWFSRLAGQLRQRLAELPKYFDFEIFAKRFRRHYNGSEEPLRRSLFLSRCLEIFKSRVAFRRGRTGYLRTINKFSDRSPSELRQMFMVAPPMEASQLSQADYLELVRRRSSQLEQADTFEGLEELESRAAVTDGADCAAGTNGSDLIGAQIGAMLEETYDEMDLAGAGAILDELEGRDIELESQTANGIHSNWRLPWPGRMRSGEESGGGGSGKGNVDRPGEEEEAEPVARLEPGAGLDWSEHECFHEVYDQGQGCGKCYVMASTALAEFYKCSELGPGRPVRRRKFSKNYVFDCAQKFSPTVMGCAGGSPLETLRFIAKAGIYNIPEWRQRRQLALDEARRLGHAPDRSDLACPLVLLQAQLPVERWGSVRVEMNPKPVPVSAPAWLAALEDGPLVVSVQMPSEGLDSYSGGVHDGAGCATSGHWHAMLLVGFGTSERGQPYWRFRNSWGPDWGERGHFRLAMSVPRACFATAVRVFREPLDW